MDQRLSLIPVRLVRIIIVSAEVTVLKNLPVNPARIGKIIGLVRIVRTGMLVRYQKRNPLLTYAREGSHKNNNFSVISLSHIAACVNVESHHRARCEIKRYIITQRTTWLSGYYPRLPFID
jgi:hypothetical protein